MVLLITNVIAIIVLGVIVWRRKRDLRAEMVPTARGLKIAGAFVLALVALIYLVFGVGEMSGGVTGGVGHLFELLAIVVLLVLVWMRPLEGGIAVFACGILSSLGFIAAMVMSSPVPQFSMISSALLITSLPQVISGVFLFAAGLLGSKTAGVQV